VLSGAGGSGKPHNRIVFSLAAGGEEFTKLVSVSMDRHVRWRSIILVFLLVYFYNLVHKLDSSKVLFFTSAKEVMFLPDFVCLSVCLCVYKITQKVMNRSF